MKEINGIQTGKEKIKILLFSDVLYIKRPNVSTMIFLQLANTFSIAADFKINT